MASSTQNAVRTVISPGRYVQGRGAIHTVGERLKDIGSTPLFVADDLVWGLVGHDVEASLRAAGLPVVRERFRGVPSAAEVDRLVGVIGSTGADVVVAVGGGSTIDAVKASGHLAGIRWANCPTVASTTPGSPWSGRCSGVRWPGSSRLRSGWREAPAPVQARGTSMP